MNWIDTGIFIAAVFAALFIFAIGMNLLWGDEDERKQAKATLMQLGAGFIIVVFGVLVVTFVVKPIISVIGSAVWASFT